MSLDEYTQQILASKDILGVNVIRDKALIDRDLNKGEFVALTKVIIKHKKQLNPNTYIK